MLRSVSEHWQVGLYNANLAYCPDKQENRRKDITILICNFLSPISNKGIYLWAPTPSMSLNE